MENLGHVHGLLAEGAVGDEEDLVRLHHGGQALHLLDQALVDLKAAGGVEDEGVGAGVGGRLQAGPPDGRHVLRGPVGVKADLLLAGKDFQLVDGGRPVDVAGDREGAVAPLL